MSALCAIPDCGKPRAADRPLCAEHCGAGRRRVHPGGRKPVHVLSRILSKCRVTPEGHWLYSPARKSGYAEATGLDGRRHPAHRSVLLIVDPPADLALDAGHRAGCPHRNCCNPGCLVWQTRVENFRDGFRRPRTRTREPICQRCGTQEKAPGQGYCRECAREVNREWYRKNAERRREYMQTYYERKWEAEHSDLDPETVAARREARAHRRAIRRPEINLEDLL